MVYSDIQLGSSVYYRYKLDIYDSFSMGGSTRLFVSQALDDLGIAFDFVSIRMDGTDNTGTVLPNNVASTIRIKKLVYSHG